MTLYAISHFIQSWLLPPGFNLLLALVAFLLWRHFKVIAKLCLIISFVSLWLLSTPVFAFKLIDLLQNQYPLIAIATLPKQETHSAIIVLGGGAVKEPEYRTIGLSIDSFNRIRYAAFIHQATHLPIITSGGTNNKNLPAIAEIMAHSLKNNFNVPTAWQENQSITTTDEARLVLPLLMRQHINTLYIITNAWHMPRSMFIFKKTLAPYGIHCIAAPMGFRMQNNDLSFLKYLPNEGALSISIIALHEYIGLLWYSLRY